MKILVDTNVLLRALQPASPFSEPARNALRILHRQGHELCLTPQNVREFWNVCTRPTDRNGFGISIAGVERHAQFLERYFTILQDSARTYIAWRQLAPRHEVMGAKVHDAYLVAAMEDYGIRQILTFNTSDFIRYDGIQPVDPGTF